MSFTAPPEAGFARARDVLFGGDADE